MQIRQKLAQWLNIYLKYLLCFLWSMQVFLVLNSDMEEKSVVQAWQIPQCQATHVSDVPRNLTWAKWNLQDSWEHRHRAEGRDFLSLWRSSFYNAYILLQLFESWIRSHDIQTTYFLQNPLWCQRPVQIPAPRHIDAHNRDDLWHLLDILRL